VLAALVSLLDVTGIRVGNEEYAAANESFGLTTLRTRHVRLDGSRVRLHFRGNTGKEHRILLDDARLARIIKRCRDLPGEALFTYLEETGSANSVSSEDVNEYLREIAGGDFSAKDFRTWIGTVECQMRCRIRNASRCASLKNGSEYPYSNKISSVMSTVLPIVGSSRVRAIPNA
jgi:DNA topoisomerase-1